MTVEPGPQATDPVCAQVLVALRGIDTLGELARRETTSQSTAAWGDPPVVLRCGVEPPGPTTERCVGVDGVDWVVDLVADPEAEATVYTTYGRVPAVQVVLPTDAPVGTDEVLGALAVAAAVPEQTRRCQ